MGNQQTKTTDPRYYENLDISRYRSMKPGLTENEIKQIYRMFQGYNPKDGKIRSEELLKKYRGGPECDDLQRLCNKKPCFTRVYQF